MRHLLLALIAVVASSASASSQGVSGIYPSPPLCPTCFVASHADSPTAGSAITGGDVFWLWGGVCHNGAWPTHITGLAVVNGHPVSVHVDYVTGGERSDVRSHLEASGCHGGHTVIAAWIPGGLPSGATTLGLQVRYYDIFAYHNFPVQP